MEKFTIIVVGIAIGLLAALLLKVLIVLVVFIGKAIVKEYCSMDLSKEVVFTFILATIIAIGFLILAH